MTCTAIRQQCQTRHKMAFGCPILWQRRELIFCVAPVCSVPHGGSSAFPVLDVLSLIQGPARVRTQARGQNCFALQMKSQ